MNSEKARRKYYICINTNWYNKQVYDIVHAGELFPCLYVSGPAYVFYSVSETERMHL